MLANHPAALPILFVLVASCRAANDPLPVPVSSTPHASASVALPALHPTPGPVSSSSGSATRLGWNIFGGKCSGDEVAKCVAKYAKAALTPADLERFIENGIAACFAQKDPEKLADQGACLPLSLGMDARNGRVVEIVYHCSDVCPSYGAIAVQYANITKQECCATGGHPRHDPAWGGYLGCSPPEIPLPRFNYPRYPGGPMEPATRSPCDPSKIVFDDGTVVVDPKVRTK